MRNKARHSITGSTGENGRVMTPEFPKAVHAVPYVRPDMGLNVSLTDLSWSMRNFWVPYNGFKKSDFFPFLPLFWRFLSLSGEKGEKVGDGSFILSITKTCIVAPSLYFSPSETPPSLGGITSLEYKKGSSFFLNYQHHAFLSVSLDWTEVEKRKRSIDGCSSSLSGFSHLDRVCASECGCVRL